MMTSSPYTLITGGAGFVGSNLADALLADGERVVIADNFTRDGVEENVRWLRARYGERLRVERVDVSDRKRLEPLVRGARRVFHLAAQVAVTTSVEDPVLDLESNLLGTFYLLEAARSAPTPPPILFTSTNKVYGGLDHIATEKRDGLYCYAGAQHGICEREPLDFHSPYGCSKGAADQYVHDYARIYGIRTVVFRMSCIYGTRQFGTEDQGWVAHFARSLLAGSPITIYGDGCQVRDILWIGDLIAAMRGAMRRLEKPGTGNGISGEIFNIGGGAENAVSVREVIDRLMRISKRDVPIRYAEWRPGDQKVYVSDTGKAGRLLDWRPTTHWKLGLERLVAWLNEARLDEPERSSRPVRAAVAAAP